RDGAQRPTVSVSAPAVGSYTWHASYSGDGLYQSAIHNGQSFSPRRSSALPSIATLSSETLGGVVGVSVLSDQAVLSGGYTPGGTITITNTATQVTTTQRSPPATGTGDGTYSPTATVTATEGGTYTWHASYS